MQFLYWLEKIRNPVFDFIFSAITYLGDELAFLVIAILVFWCVNKRSGYFLLTSGFFGTVFNQTLKLACKIPRPFHKDLSFTIVESAREGAGGFSFPSGHSQNAVSTFGALFLTTKKLWFKITLGVIAALVLFSRMYLGVHTPWDVIAGASSALVIILLLEDVFKKDELFNKVMPYLVGALTLAAAGFFVYAIFFNPLPEEAHITYDSIFSAKKNAATLLGCALGLVLVYPLDRFVIKFETGARWYSQIIKLVVGLAVILGIKEGFKALLEPSLGVYARIIYYFIMVAFAGAVWPLTFSWFASLEIPALDRFAKWVASLFKRPFRIEKAAGEKEIPAPQKVKNTTPTYFGENSMYKKKKRRK